MADKTMTDEKEAACHAITALGEALVLTCHGMTARSGLPEDVLGIIVGCAIGAALQAMALHYEHGQEVVRIVQKHIDQIEKDMPNV